MCRDHNTAKLEGLFDFGSGMKGTETQSGRGSGSVAIFPLGIGMFL